MKSGNTFIVEPETSEQEKPLKAFVEALDIKFELRKEESYDPEFVDKIQRSRKQIEDGKVAKVDLDDIWKE
jgi:hypothetical protein